MVLGCAYLRVAPKHSCWYKESSGAGQPLAAIPKLPSKTPVAQLGKLNRYIRPNLSPKRSRTPSLTSSRHQSGRIAPRQPPITSFSLIASKRRSLRMLRPMTCPTPRTLAWLQRCSSTGQSGISSQPAIRLNTSAFPMVSATRVLAQKEVKAIWEYEAPPFTDHLKLLFLTGQRRKQFSRTC